jgi:putative endonuclease
MKYFVYILLCDQKTYYIGSTDNLERRLKEHQSKKSFYTKQFSDLKLIYTEGYETRLSAEKREFQIKGWSVAKKKALVDNDLDALKKLSRSK